MEGQTDPQKTFSTTGLTVLREENFDVPGGKEHFHEWQTAAANGVTKKFITHSFRIDGDGTYVTHSNLKIHTWAAGADLNGEPQSTTGHVINLYAVKGEVTGSVRHDRITMTMVQPDGQTMRQTLTVPVRLDLAELNDLDLAGTIARMGELFPSGISGSLGPRDDSQGTK
jgi:2-phospho-L-lactate transferase/gluconeogenesis factor (CofD/UPF0052 family)